MYSIEEGLGYGRIRVSLLFRPVEAKLPPNLLGFDTGTLEIHDISVKPDQSADLGIDLAKCELRIKTTKSDGSEKLSRKTAHREENGTVIWDPERSEGDDDDDSQPCAVLPVRQRYGSALLLSFKDSSTASGLKRSSGRYALSVLWLRDLVDNVDGPVELTLWKARDGDFSRLKLNYVPPSGDLAYWDSDKEKVERVGTLRMRVKFKPGISEKHKTLLDGGGAKQKEAWDAFTREKAGGLRDSVGEMEVRGDQAETSGSGSGEETSESGVKHGQKPTDGEATVVGDDETGTDGPVFSVNGDGDHASDDDNASGSGRPGLNTVVSSEAVENASLGSSSDQQSYYGDDEVDGEKKGLRQKFKDWKEHERELHQDHRGIMQMKPARTATWIKDNVEEGAHAVKERFSMRTRKPDVETEV